MPSFFSRLFRHRPDSATTDSALIAAMKQRTVPALAVEHCEQPTGSAIGGSPDLSSAHQWPEWRDVPLAFLAQLDCAAMRAAGGPDWLPARGTLFFFYHPEQETWGFDPEDRGSWAVIHDADGRADAPIAPPADLTVRYGALPVDFRLIESMPDPDRLVEFGPDAFDTAAWDDAYTLLDSSSGTEPRHQVGGFPRPVQGDSMELECQLASNGIYLGNGDGYSRPEAEALSAGATEWRLLLQLDTDDDVDMMWGDCGTLYFWIRESDARAGNFDAAWMVLQCA